jgi:hypothetical protein
MRARQLLAQGRHQALRQHQHPVLAALAMPHEHCAVREVHVLDAQPQSLRQAHPGAVQQLCEQSMLAVQAAKHGRQLVPRQHYRQPSMHTRPPEFGHPRQLQPQHLRIQEQQRR